MNHSAEFEPSTRSARFNRIPFVRRWGRHCDHRWSEPVLLRNATYNTPALASWSCLECGKRQAMRRIG